MKLLALLAAALVTAACAGERPQKPPEVTFAANGQSVAARPTQHCDVTVENCKADPQAAVMLRVPPGRALGVAVPPEVAQTPWLVVFGYRTRAGERVNARSAVFAGNGQSSFTLTLPDAADQLETVEVQQVGGAVVSGAQGVEFPARATWVLSVDDGP